jgi:hypothetical protein
MENIMNNEFTIKDSGKRESFNGGAVRDVAEDKSRPDLISPFFKERFGEHLRKGAQKYSAWNWAKGIPNSRCMESCERHIMQFMQGDRTEDHLCAAVANLMFMIHNEEVVKKGYVLKTDMNNDLVDLPVFKSVCSTGSVMDTAQKAMDNIQDGIRKGMMFFGVDWARGSDATAYAEAVKRVFQKGGIPIITKARQGGKRWAYECLKKWIHFIKPISSDNSKTSSEIDRLCCVCVHQDLSPALNPCKQCMDGSGKPHFVSTESSHDSK